MIKILEYSEKIDRSIFATPKPINDVSGAVSEILSQVKREGDAALFALEERFDKVKLDSLRVSQEEIAEGVAAVEPEFLKILQTSAQNIKEYHQKQLRDGFEIKRGEGVILGQRITPIERVGL